IAEKQSFRLVDLGQGFGAFFLFLISSGIRDARRNLPSDEIDKSGVAHIERPVRIKAGDEDAGRFVLRLAGNRQKQRARRGCVPGSRWERLEARNQVFYQYRIFSREKSVEGPLSRG